MQPLITPGAQVVVRDEERLVKGVADTFADGQRIEAIGVSEFGRETEAVFCTGIDDVVPLDPARTELVADDSPGFRRSRLWLEALLRRTPLPLHDSRIAVGHRALLDDLSYQRRPAERALSNLRPRILVADAVGLGKTLEIGIILAELIKLATASRGGRHRSPHPGRPGTARPAGVRRCASNSTKGMVGSVTTVTTGRAGRARTVTAYGTPHRTTHPSIHRTPHKRLMGGGPPHCAGQRPAGHPPSTPRHNSGTDVPSAVGAGRGRVARHRLATVIRSLQPVR